MPAATLTPERRRTFTAGTDVLDHPVDVLGRARFRAALDATSVHVTRSLDPAAAIPFGGTAILFNKRTWIGSRDFGFWEQISPEAVTKTLLEADVRFLQNHNPDLLLARTNPGMRADSAATLELTASSGGLLVAADMAPTSYAQDLAILLERRDISQMSFAFDPLAWTREQLPDGSMLITITELRLFDVAVVTYPAYEETDAGLRAAAFDAWCRDDGLDPSDVMRRYLAGGTMPETTSSTPVRAQAADKRARIVTPETRSLNGWTLADLWPLLDEAIVDYCSTEDFNAYWYVYLVDVSDEWFVYYDDRPGAGHSYWQVTYTVTSEGEVALGEPVEVVCKMTYIPVTAPPAPEPDDDPAAAVGDATEFSAEPSSSRRMLLMRTGELATQIAGVG